MVNTPINEIIETAVKLSGQIQRDYLYEMQSQSNFSAKVFFGLLKSGIEKIKDRDRELINKLKKIWGCPNWSFYWEYGLLEVLVDDFINMESFKTELTPEKARILGYDVNPNLFKSNSGNSEKTNKPKSKKYSYQWLGKPDELKELFESMKGNFLSNNNKLDDFIKVFSKVEINPNLKPIRWKNDVASEVLFFIKILGEKGLIEKFNRMDYVKLKLLFVKPDGNLFDGDLKVSYNRLDIDFSQKKQKELSNLLNGFL